MEELFMPSFLKPKKTQFPKDYSLAMAYIPVQDSIEVYNEAEGLDKGTIFPELNKPFKGKFVKEVK